MDFYDANRYFPDLRVTNKLRLCGKPRFHEMKLNEDYIIFDPSDKTSRGTIKSIVPSEDSKSYYAYVEIRAYAADTVEYLNGYISLNSSAIDIMF